MSVCIQTRGQIDAWLVRSNQGLNNVECLESHWCQFSVANVQEWTALRTSLCNHFKSLSVEFTSFCIIFKTLDISQGSVATHLRCGGIFSDSIITNFIPILTVK